MDCHIIQGRVEDLRKVLTPNLQKLSILKITPAVNTQQALIQGRVTQKWPIQRQKDIRKSLLKITITEGKAPGGASINVFMVGYYAEQCQAIPRGSFVCLNNFYVENNTSATTGAHQCQIIVDKNRSQAKIWVAEPLPATTQQTLRSAGQPSSSTAGQPSSTAVQPSSSTAIQPSSSTAGQPSSSTAGSSKASQPSASTADQPSIAGQPSTSTSKVTQPNPGLKQIHRTYEYTPLNALKENTDVNVYGIVKFLKPPSKTRGRDYMMLLSLTDPSMARADPTEEVDKLKCVFFAGEEKNLPNVKAVGDIVRLHRLRIQMFNGSLQGAGRGALSWLVFAGQEGASLTPHSNSATYTITDNDKKKVVEYRKWAKKQTLEMPSPRKVLPQLTTFRDMQLQFYFDIVCQVVSIHVIDPGVSILFRCWDGTKTNLPVFEVDTGEAASQAHTDEVLEDTAAGYLYDVSVFDDHFYAASGVCVGDFVKFTNLHAAKCKNEDNGLQHAIVPTLELCLHRGSTYSRGLRVLDPHDPQLRDLTVRLDAISEEKRLERLANISMQQSGELDVTPGTSRPLTCQAKTTAQQKRTGKSPEKNGLKGPAGSAKKSSAQKPGTSQNAGKSGETESEEEVTVISPSPPAKRKVNRSLKMTSSSPRKRPRCMQRTATVLSGHHHIERSSIADVQARPAPYKFRIQARVQNIQPKVKVISDLIQLYCEKCHFSSSIPVDTDNSATPTPRESGMLSVHDACAIKDGIPVYPCPQCSQTSPSKTRRKTQDITKLTYIIRLKFLLDDGRDWLVAYLWKKHAEHFFHDVKAVDILNDPSLFSSVQADLSKLTRRNGLWMECCLQSYHAGTETMYHIFDTTMAIDD